MSAGASALADVERELLSGWATAPLCPHIFASALWTRLRTTEPSAQLDATTRELGEALALSATAGLLPLEHRVRAVVDHPFLTARRLLASTDLQTLPADVARLRKELGQALGVALQSCRATLVGLQKVLETLLAAEDQETMDPFVRAVAAISPESALIRSHRAARVALEALVAQIAVLLKPLLKGVRRGELDAPPGVLLQGLSSVAKSIETACALAGRFTLPQPTLPLGDDWTSLATTNNTLDLLNRAFYGLRGASIYEDFTTPVSHDPLQARADAASFREHLGSLAPAPEAPHAPSSRPRSQPQPLVHVLEVGVGGGHFSADFLTNMRGCANLHYWLGDISEAMLADAQRHLSTFAHEAQVGVITLHDLEDSQRRFDLQRFNELFDDLPECAVLYVDAEGRIWNAEVRGTIPSSTSCDVPGLARALKSTDLERLREVSADDLARIRLEVRFVPIGRQDLAYGDLLPQLLQGVRDVLVPFNIGGARFLEQCLGRAGANGLVRIYDYGLPRCQAAARYEKSSFVVRYYGGNPTRDVLFPLLQAVAERQGFATVLRPLDDFMSRTLGCMLVAFEPLMSDQGQLLTSGATLDDDAPLPVSSLRCFPEIVEVAAQMGDDVERYAEFVSQLARRGWLDLGLPPNEWPQARSLMEALALDLAFSVSAVFRDPGRQAVAEKKSWILDPDALEGIATRLTSIGYSEGAVNALFSEPRGGKFWLLECRAPS